MSDLEPRIDPDAQTCKCYGAPINPIWRDRWQQALIGYQCGRCGHSWPVRPDHSNRPAPVWYERPK